MKKPAKPKRKKPSHSKKPGKGITLTNSDGDHYLATDEIVSVEACKGQTCAHVNSVCPSEQKVVVCHTLDKMEEILGSLFMRVHRSWLVRKNYVRKYLTGASHSLLMKTSQKVPVSKGNRAKVRAVLRQLHPSIH